MRTIYLQYFNDCDTQYLCIGKKDDVNLFICLNEDCGLGLPRYIIIKGKVKKYNKLSGGDVLYEGDEFRGFLFDILDKIKS